MPPGHIHLRPDDEHVEEILRAYVRAAYPRQHTTPHDGVTLREQRRIVLQHGIDRAALGSVIMLLREDVAPLFDFLAAEDARIGPVEEAP